MDDSPPSDCDYAEQVAAQNNMDIVADNAPPIRWPPEVQLCHAAFTNAMCPQQGHA